MADENGTDTKNVVSVSSGGESVTLDVAGKKADDRAEMNDDLTNQVNRRVRPYFLGARITRVSGW